MDKAGSYRPSILLVEDERLTREQLGEILVPVSSQLYLAENGEEGLSLYQQVQPDIVITDIIMPVMNGLDMARQIRLYNANAKIIGLTAFSEIDDLTNPNRTVTDYCLFKPINLEKLFEAMNFCTEAILTEKRKQEPQSN